MIAHQQVNHLTLTLLSVFKAKLQDNLKSSSSVDRGGNCHFSTERKMRKRFHLVNRFDKSSKRRSACSTDLDLSGFKANNRTNQSTSQFVFSAIEMIKKANRACSLVNFINIIKHEKNVLFNSQ